MLSVAESKRRSGLKPRHMLTCLFSVAGSLSDCSQFALSFSFRSLKEKRKCAHQKPLFLLTGLWHAFQWSPCEEALNYFPGKNWESQNQVKSSNNFWKHIKQDSTDFFLLDSYEMVSSKLFLLLAILLKKKKPTLKSYGAPMEVFSLCLLGEINILLFISTLWVCLCFPTEA